MKDKKGKRKMKTKSYREMATCSERESQRDTGRAPQVGFWGISLRTPGSKLQFQDPNGDITSWQPMGHTVQKELSVPTGFNRRKQGREGRVGGDHM